MSVTRAAAIDDKIGGSVVERCKTKYGEIKGIDSVSFYATGELNECRIDNYFEITTAVGKLIPRYEDDGKRTKYTKSLSFYKNGDIKSISLNKQTIVSTPIGEVPAELITFYENEKIKKVFPLNGKITAFWTEKDEYELAEEREISFSFGTLNAKVDSISFYPGGEVKCVTLWSKQTVSINTPCGLMNIRIGISLYKDGTLFSCEPAMPVQVDTNIGIITAYDINALAVDGGKNSLNFYEDGTIKSLYTSTDKIEVRNRDGNITVFEPKLKRSLFNDDAMDIIPLRIEFNNGRVTFDNDMKNEFKIESCEFKVTNFSTNITSETNNCSGCGD